MKLHYYNGKNTSLKVSNFGDELNPWLWNKLIPDLLIHKNKTLFVGIGTLLNSKLPKAANKVVFGAGVGYGEPPKIDSTYKIYFVRGKLSAQALKLDAELGLTDPAILIRKFYTPSERKQYKWSYMPHFSEAIHNGLALKEICHSLNIHYIDPTSSLEQVLAEIDKSETLFSEAMHGAIVADALRIPWVPVKMREGILAFKWQDWLSSINISYKPVYVHRAASLIGKKGFLRYCDYQSIRTQMLFMVRSSKPNLSSLKRCEELEEKVLLKLEAVKSDFTQGLLD